MTFPSLMQLGNGPLYFEFIANACGILTGKNGTKILCDPWLVDGVFEGSWCHFEKLKTKPQHVRGVDAIYISHIHPDHFDERYFNFEKSTLIIVLDHSPNFLIRKLNSLGYTNLLKIKDGQTIKFREFELTMFAPFSKHHFYEAAIGNMIDSALLVSCDGVSALNSNDNVLTTESAERLYDKFGAISFAMLNYTSAGPYPACFDNLTESEKHSECLRIKIKYFYHLKNIIEILKPKFVFPFASAHVLGGDLHSKNKYLATATWDECANWLVKNGIPPSKVISLRERDCFDIKYGTSNNPYNPIDDREVKRYIAKELSKIKYPHQHDTKPDEEALIIDIETASLRMVERMTRFGIKSNFKVSLSVFGKNYQIFPAFKKLDNSKAFEYVLHCSLDERLLRRILDKRAHWNNAEGGAHISFFRTPNQFEPDLHVGLQFFHL